MTGIVSSLLCCCEDEPTFPPACASRWLNCPEDLYVDVPPSTVTYAVRHCRPPLPDWFTGYPQLRTPCSFWQGNCLCPGGMCRYVTGDMREFGSYSVWLENFRFKKRVLFSPSLGYRVDYLPALGLEQTGVLRAEYVFVDRKVKEQGGDFNTPPTPCNYWDVIKRYYHEVPLRTQGPYTVTFGPTGIVSRSTFIGVPPNSVQACDAELTLDVTIDHATGLERVTESNIDPSEPCAVPYWNGGPYTEYLPLQIRFGLTHITEPRALSAPPLCPTDLLNMPVSNPYTRTLYLGPPNLPVCLCPNMQLPCSQCGYATPGYVENVPYPPCPEPGVTFGGLQTSRSIEIAEPIYSSNP